MTAGGWQFLCTHCDRLFPLDRPRALCDCGGILDLAAPTDPLVVPEGFAGPGLGRFAPVLPLDDDDTIIHLGERTTPLLEDRLDQRTFLFKVESTLPSGSWKDRGYFLLVNHLARWGLEEVAGDSSGNAACALAAYCARAGIRAVLYVPAGASPGKLRLLDAYGAEIRLVPEGRSAARDRALEHGRRTFYAGHVTHPLFLHGVKTMAYEIYEQLGGAAPRGVVLPLGNGTLLLGVLHGFRELYRAGCIDAVPKLFAVQAEACGPLAAAWRDRRDTPATIEPRPTMAEGIAIASPPRGAEILRAVRATGGAVTAVTEAHIGSAHTRLARRGLLVEPTSAAALAGVLTGDFDVDGLDPVVVILTGSGLKTVPMD
jgi:threonine synthase